MEKKLIDLYKEWMETGKLPSDVCGLCGTLQNKAERKYYELWKELFYLDGDERKELQKEGFDFTYFASGLPADHKNEINGFTPLRQTIVLLICAMCDEL